jgi:YD repeat-containing protein
MLRSSQTRVYRVTATLLLAGATFASIFIAHGQAQPAPDVCDTVRYLMEREITPYDLEMGGGVIQPGQSQQGTFGTDYYADTWSFNVVLPRNLGGFAIPDVLTVSFETVAPDLDLEIAVFSRMRPVDVESHAGDADSAGYVRITGGERYSYRLTRDGAHTLIVRRANVADQSPGDYTFTADFAGGGAITLDNLRDNTTNRLLALPPTLADGREIIQLEAAEITIHPEAPTSISTHGGVASQVRFGPAGSNYGLLVNAWADHIMLLGGDLAVTGSDAGRQRMFYLKNYGYEVDALDGNFATVIDSDGTRFRVGWQAVSGVWITDRCAGFKLEDGRTFTGTLGPNNRDVTFRGGLSDFNIQLLTPRADNTPALHQINLNWQGIALNSESQLLGGVFSANLTGSRQIRLESTQIDLRHQSMEDARPLENLPLVAQLGDRQASIRLDWSNLERFSLAGGQIEMTFLDEARTTTTRSADDLLRFDALENVIEIVYQNIAAGVPGEHHLLLPAAEDYIEIVTPAGLPAFDGRALPGEDGYAPRALNNLGGECYPINTLQPQANCPLNGHPNPANGNLWYAVTDHLAHGGPIDLALTRSYNSAAHQTGGPFGFGWTTAFLLDYAVPFDPQQNTRPVHITDRAYPTGLDLTWAPRGIVTFTTPSGSQHVFVTSSNQLDGGTLTALTMPGWTLHRDSVRDLYWTLRQDDGLVYRFDRAGRLVSYGYPDQGHLITVEYPHGTPGGPGGLGESTPVIITDAPNLRRLELYYDAEHRIIRSVLRDTSLYDDLAQIDTANCSVTASCYETHYTYDGGYLTGVIYPDGSRATYTYDDSGRLSGHDDPRAPVSPVMAYTYGEAGAIQAEITPPDGASFVWRNVNRVRIDEGESTRFATVTDEYGSTRTYTYAWTAGALKAVDGSFTLIAETSPLEDVTAIETIPIEYGWINGLLERTHARLLEDAQAGRNSVVFEYGDGHNITRIRSGYPGFRASYTQHAGMILPQTLTFADDTTMTFTYDVHGWLDTLTDRTGGLYQYRRDSAHRPTTIESAGDLTATDYTYNEVGQVTSVTQRRFTDSQTNWYTVEIRYDGLGRIVAVDDPLTGSYSVEYGFLRESSEAALSTVTVADPTGAITTASFDSTGKLVERHTTQGVNGDLLRRTTYTYDALNRVATETRWLTPFDGAEADITLPLTTRYTYSALPVLTNQPGEIGANQRVINGYQITITDAHGRTWRYAYDALDRIRQVENELRHITRYDYLTTEIENNINGLTVIQREIRDNTLFSTTEYIFDLRWQLRSVTLNGETFEFFFEGDTTRLQALRARLAGLAEQTWNAYTQGRPAETRMVQVPSALNQEGNAPALSLTADYDFRGRPTHVTDSGGTTYNVLYCPLEFGAQKTVYFHTTTTSANNNNGDEYPCDSGDFARAVYHDARGRLMRVDDSGSTRTYTYTAQPGGWNVQVTFTDSTSAAEFNWQLIYNGAGDLVRWVDENGITRNYRYDILGRLRRVEVPGQPEASFTFDYNAADLLISELDDLGRGTFYNYNERGQLTVKQDARTANATIYGYNARGQLSTVISPLGSTTTFRYDDPTDPARLTGIIEPTGNNIQFAWEDANNRLVYTGPRGNSTAYTFDSFGALWRIDDALGRTHELHYDPAGRLSQWRQSQPASGRAARHLLLDYPDLYQINLSANDSQIGWERHFTLTPLRQLESLSSDAGHRIGFAYDPLGRLTQVQTSERLWTLTHQHGRPTLEFTDGFGGRHLLGFDALNRLVAAETDDQSIGYSYHPGRGGDVNLIIEDGSGRVITYSAGDETSRPPAVILREPGQRHTYSYNTEGILAEITSEACINPLFRAPDPLLPDDCVRIAPDEVWRTTERFVYDALGRPTRYIDQEQDIQSFAYDDSGNLVIYQDASDKTFNYTYDALNRLESIAGPTGVRLLLAYDDLDRVSGICRGRVEDRGTYADCVSAGGVLETYTYDALGRLQTQTYPNMGQQTTITHFYDQQNNGLLSGWGTHNEPDVTIARASDALGLVESFTVDEDTYHFTYPSRTQLSSANGADSVVSTYDALGRVESIMVGGHRLIYEYAPDNRSYRIYDEVTGAEIGFSLDEHGFLAGIENNAQFDYFLSPDARLLIVQITRADGELIELQLNHRGEPQNIAYTGSNLFVDYVHDATGQIQRQSIIGSSRYFEMEAAGYIIVIGYDNDNRPLTVRVNDRERGQLLYLLTFTYNAAGQREIETRQYSDGTQVSIQHVYENASQLVQRRVTISQAQNLLFNASPLLALGGLAWLMRTPVRRRSALLMLFAGLLAAVTLSWSTAQPTNGTVYTYSYDDRGNLTRIGLEDEDTICARYTYDSANRLVQVVQGDRQQTYSYDARNRLSSAGSQRFAYLGDSNMLIAAYDSSGTPRYHAQTADLPEIYLEGAQTSWLLNDGHGHMLAAIIDGQSTGPVWLFDPLGRFLSLHPPAADADPCSALAPLPAEFLALSPLQTFQRDMVWDAATNLYFLDGRAYAPELGRFLQRDPQGPDAFGSVYSYPSRQTVPPVRERPIGYADGIYRLRDALDTIHTADRLTAEHIRAQQQPAPRLHEVEPFTGALDDLARSTHQRLTRHLDLPAWLATSYNLPAPYVDAGGALRLIRDNAPGQGGTGDGVIPTNTIFNPTTDWLPSGVASSAYLEQIINITQPPPQRPLTVYEPFAWQPLLPRLDMTWHVAAPYPDDTRAPGAVLDWLPRPLAAPQNSAGALDVVAALDALPQRDGETWLDAALNAALPAPPYLPPLTSEAWLANWFTDDTLGIAKTLNTRWPALPRTDTPVYRLGANSDWRLSQRR